MWRRSGRSRRRTRRPRPDVREADIRVSVLSIGRLGAAPESALARRYLERASATGRALGLGPFDLVEIEPRKAGRAGEADALRAAAADAVVIACDERGEALPSRAFAARMAGLRDQGARRAVFLIGGADGLDPALVAEARFKVAFGPQTWPHALARAMLCEQLYRSATILAGGPYHRD